MVTSYMKRKQTFGKNDQILKTFGHFGAQFNPILTNKNGRYCQVSLDLSLVDKIN
jgi:hypothetical protein